LETTTCFAGGLLHAKKDFYLERNIIWKEALFLMTSIYSFHVSSVFYLRIAINIHPYLLIISFPFVLLKNKSGYCS